MTTATLASWAVAPVCVGRRGVMIAAASAALTRPAAARPPIPDSRVLSFRVIRSGSQIGTHVLTFAPSGNALTVRVSVDFAVGFGPITFYRYVHRAVERWEDGAVVSLDAETDDNGAIGRTTARRVPDGYRVEGRKAPPYLAPPDTLPATHWNRRMLEGPMINTQTGELLRPVVTRVGPARVKGPAGGITSADHFSLRGDVELDTWYDATPAWVGLRFVAPDGSRIWYERT